MTNVRTGPRSGNAQNARTMSLAPFHLFRRALAGPPLALAGAMAAAEPARLEFPAPADSWAEALPVSNGRAAALVMDTPGSTRLRWFPPPPGWLEQARAERSDPGSRDDGPPADGGGVTIEWLADGEPAAFGRVLEADGRAVSRLRIGRTTFTRTVLADPGGGPVFVHLLADMPGALGFRVTMAPPGGGRAAVADRRQLQWRAAGAGAGEGEDVREARLWVLPFESEVEPEAAAIVVRGEGEALMILDFGPGDRSGTLAALGRKHDSGGEPPDPVRIWRGVAAAAAAGGR